MEVRHWDIVFNGPTRIASKRCSASDDNEYDDEINLNNVQMFLKYLISLYVLSDALIIIL